MTEGPVTHVVSAVLITAGDPLPENFVLSCPILVEWDNAMIFEETSTLVLGYRTFQEKLPIEESLWAGKTILVVNKSKSTSIGSRITSRICMNLYGCPHSSTGLVYFNSFNISSDQLIIT